MWYTDHQSSWPNHTEGATYNPGELCCFPGRLIKSMNQYETHIVMSIGLLVETSCQIEVKLKSHHSYMFRRQKFETSVIKTWYLERQSCISSPADFWTPLAIRPFLYQNAKINLVSTTPLEVAFGCGNARAPCCQRKFHLGGGFYGPFFL